MAVESPRTRDARQRRVRRTCSAATCCTRTTRGATWQPQLVTSAPGPARRPRRRRRRRLPARGRRGAAVQRHRRRRRHAVDADADDAAAAPGEPRPDRRRPAGCSRRAAARGWSSRRSRRGRRAGRTRRSPSSPTARSRRRWPVHRGTTTFVAQWSGDFACRRRRLEGADGDRRAAQKSPAAPLSRGTGGTAARAHDAPAPPPSARLGADRLLRPARAARPGGARRSPPRS